VPWRGTFRPGIAIIRIYLEVSELVEFSAGACPKSML